MFARILAVVLMVSLTGLTGVATANDHDRARNKMRSGEVMSFGQIKRNVQRQVPGRLLDTELQRSGNGRWTYRVKVLNQSGNVQTVIVDAKTGRVMSVRGN